jgi:hypothetical protein
MPVRRAIPVSTPAEWAPERSLREVQKQLTELLLLKDLRYDEGRPKELAWKQVTDSVLRRAFSSDSPVILHFFRASSSGSYSMGGMPPGRMQANYHARMTSYETALNTALADLKLSLPEDVAGVYEAEDPFSFYKDLKALLRRASAEVFVVDAYVDVSLFELYLGDISAPKIRLLSNQISPTVKAVANIFAKSHSNFELRSAQSLHDRVVFIDDRCWVIGQSIKDAAAKKPTYMVEIAASGMKTTYDDVWNTASQASKS